MELIFDSGFATVETSAEKMVHEDTFRWQLLIVGVLSFGWLKCVLNSIIVLQ